MIRTGFVFLAGLLFSSCVSSDVDRAFGGKLEPFKETAVIVDYCQSCHVHRKFNPSAHMGEKPFLYKNPPYAAAADCKTCHSIERNFWGDVKEITHFPGGAIVETR